MIGSSPLHAVDSRSGAARAFLGDRGEKHVEFKMRLLFGIRSTRPPGRRVSKNASNVSTSPTSLARPNCNLLLATCNNGHAEGKGQGGHQDDAVARPEKDGQQDSALRDRRTRTTTPLRDRRTTGRDRPAGRRPPDAARDAETVARMTAAAPRIGALSL